MLARWEDLFPSMLDYDIAPLLAEPSVGEYLSRTYFGPDGLSAVSVKRSSVACTGIFRWCSSSLSRINAARELLVLRAELEELKAQEHCRFSGSAEANEQPESAFETAVAEQDEEFIDFAALSANRPWVCDTNTGWQEFPQSISERLRTEFKTGGCVSYEVDWDKYEADLVLCIQKNALTGFKRPIRMLCETVDVISLQGLWSVISDGHNVRKVRVQGNSVWLDQKESASQLVPQGKQPVEWTFSTGQKWHASGSPLRVVWLCHEEEQMTWIPTAYE
jgi:hypothetical protein